MVALRLALVVRREVGLEAELRNEKRITGLRPPAGPRGLH
jgi:hypothetical protein